MTDGDEDTVYVAVSQNGVVTKKYHTDADCPKLQKAANTRPRARSTLFDSMTECKVCSGEATASEPWQGGHFQSLLEAAKAGGETGD